MRTPTRRFPRFHWQRFQGRGVGFTAYVWRGGPGPVVLVNGATHGDEYEGPTLLRGLVERWRPAGLRGTLIVVPVLNEPAFFAGRRCTPVDGGNLARAFPGRASGSTTSRLAHLFESGLLARCTHYIDLHSAGAAAELLPWVGYIDRDDDIGREQRAMAACFDDFWCWSSAYLPGRTLSAAFARNIPAIYIECTGTGGVAPRDLRALDRGLRNLLRSTMGKAEAGSGLRLKVQAFYCSKEPEEAHLQAHHPAPHRGLFVPAVKLGDRVRRGQEIGVVQRIERRTEKAIRAERSGRIVMMRHQRSVEPGDALFTIVPLHASMPPSTSHVEPVTYFARSVQRK